MGCPWQKKSENTLTRLAVMKEPARLDGDLKSNDFKYDQLICGTLLDMAGLPQDLSSWCLKQEHANKIISNVSISTSGTSSGNIPAGNTYLGQLVTHDLLGETLNSSPTSHRFPIEERKLSGTSEPTKVLNQFNLDTLYPSSFEYALEHS